MEQKKQFYLYQWKTWINVTEVP